MTKPIKNIVCTATLKDIHVWTHASQAVARYIEAERYVLIVPERYVSIFKAVSSPRFEVVGETVVVPEFDLAYVAARMPAENRSRAGWYYQQLLKIGALLHLPSKHDDALLIWDADTIPLRNLQFVQEGRLIYHRGAEHHQPYFDVVRNLIGFEKNVNFSFIAQCFPIFRGWLEDFVALIESRHGIRWYDAILKTAELSKVSGFSEYETMGTFLANSRPERMLTSNAAWVRRGNRVCPIERLWSEVPATEVAYVSYETWDPIRIPANARELPKPRDEHQFIDVFFNDIPGSRMVIQVGANDGVMEDPLSRYLRNEKYNDVSAVLIEPLDHYFESLTRLHAGRPNTLMLRAAMGAGEAVRNFYHIAPEIADGMNGDGPPNNWAHGQGSFSREIVEFWIKQNSFRGETYRANINRYLGAIRETVVNVMPLRSLALGAVDNTLLVIDVQGAELDVLLGVNWRRRPNWVILEQDLDDVGMTNDFLGALGYAPVCGSHNVVWGLVEAPLRFTP